MDSGQDLNWCICDKKAIPGELYCSMTCRDAEWRRPPSSYIGSPSVQLSPALRSQNSRPVPTDFTLGSPLLAASPQLRYQHTRSVELSGDSFSLGPPATMSLMPPPTTHHSHHNHHHNHNQNVISQKSQSTPASA